MTDQSHPEAEERKFRTAGVFSRAAATYDQLGPRFFSILGHRLVELAQIPQGSTVLDVASGRGASLFAAAERVGLSGRVVGIDLAEGMVEALMPEIGSWGLANVEARLMDAEDLSFPDSTFDYVLCGFCLFFFPNLDRALSEMVRVLKPHGRLVSSTWGKEESQWKWVDDLLESYLPEPSPSQEESQRSTHDFETPEGMEAIMRGAGLSNARIVSDTPEFTYASEEEWWSIQWSHGMRGYLERIEATLGNEALAKFKTQAFETLRGLKSHDGIHQRFPVLYTVASKP